MAQPTLRVTIQPSPHSKVSLTQPAGSSAVAFSKWMPSRGAGASLLISNDSDQPIVAVSTLWTTIDADGKRQGKRQRIETIFTSQRPVVLAHSGALLTPDTCIRLEDVSSIGGLGVPRTTTLPSLASAAELRIQVDGILFGDGKMFGSDGPAYADDIRYRMRAAGRLASSVRHALARGGDRVSIISGLAESAKDLPGPEAKWYRAFLGSLGSFGLRDDKLFEGYLKHLEAFTLSVPITVVPKE